MLGDPDRWRSEAPGTDELLRIATFSAGEPIDPAYGPLIRAESDFEGTDPRRFEWEAPADPAALAAFHVAIIGAGLGGVCAGIRLEQAGIPYTIFDKNDGVGGVWWENVYPALRVDVPNLFYSYSFAPQCRLVQLLLAPRRAAGLRRAVRRRVRGHRSRPIRPRGARGRLRPRVGAVDAAGATGRRRTHVVRVQRRHQRSGDAEPAVSPRPPRPRHVRGTVVPLVALARRPRRDREARRRGRDGCEQRAARACDRTVGRAPRRVPALEALDDAEPGVPLTHLRRRPAPHARRPALRRLVPLPRAVELVRPHVPGVPRRPRLVDAGALDQPRRTRRCAGPDDRSTSTASSATTRTSSPGAPRLPAAGQAHAAGRRLVRDLEARQRRPRRRTDRPRRARRGGHPRRRDAPGRRPRARDRLPRPAVPVADRRSARRAAASTTSGATSPAPTSASPSRASPTSSASTGRTPTRSSAA